VDWKGYTWDLRDGGTGGPGFGGWSSANVVGPDANGYLTLKLTNPSGSAPIGCEIDNQTTGLGYGTYTVVVDARLDNLDKNIVFGGLFPYFYGNPYIEFDVNETSRWDSSSNVLISHNVWYGANDNITENGNNMNVPSDVVQTHRFIWEPGKATFDSFLGTGTGGTNYFHTVITNNVPAPSEEQVIVNLWAFAEGTPSSDDKDAPAKDVILRDFTFSALGSTPPATTYTVTVNNGLGGGTFSVGDEVTIVANLPATSMGFSKWTGNTQYLNSVTSYINTFTMPAANIYFTATYQTETPTTGFSEAIAYNAALQMSSANENNSTQLQYNYAEYLGDGRGITIGAVGFCTGTYDANEMIKYYTTLNPNNNLAKYIPALNAIDAGPHNDDVDEDGNDSIVGLNGFIAAVQSNNDPLFGQAQLSKINELYWNPAHDLFTSIGAKNNLTMAFIFDMSERHGLDGAEDLLNKTTNALGGTPGTGLNENTYLTKLIYFRDIALEEEGIFLEDTDPDVDVNRDTGFKAILASGNINLVTPYSYSVYGDLYTIKPNVYVLNGVAPTTYALTVTNGSGDGAYASGTKVTITANTSAPGKVFDKWTGSTAYIASTTSPTTTVTMPSSAITLTATYKDVPKYTLTVTNGTGDGSYAQGTETVIIADVPATGKVFDKWTGSTSCINSTTSPTAIVTMPASSIALTATYKDAPSYALTIGNGTGDGSYKAGTKVTITADTPATGKVFDKWTGSTSYIASTTSSTTTVTMPSSAITITATYKDATKYTLTITNGTGDGSYTAGAKVTITADTPATSKVFDKWTGSTTHVSSIYTSTATVTMPASSVTLTATYKDAAVSTYNLTITNGTGDGSYTAGTQVTITADTPATGKVFDKWTGATSYISSTTSATTKVTMPSSAITLTAIYKDSDLLDSGTSFLMIGYGSGDGAYPVGTEVTITAKEPAKGLVFDKWTRDIEYVSDIYSTTPTVTIPDHGIILVATFKRADDETFKLIVSNGTGGDDYLPGTEVTITADTPDTDKVFDQWVGDISHIDDVTKATAIVTMPEEDITLVATYENITQGEYLLTVRSGSGYGAYALGTQVTIKADNPPAGKIFSRWTGNTSYITDITSATTTVTMPSLSITLTATYKDKDSNNGNYPDGTLIKLPDSPKVYVIVDGEKKWISTPEVFEQLGYQWTEVQTTTEEILSTLEDIEDNLIRLIGDFKIYLVTNGTKRHIPNPDVFLNYGFNWNDVKEVDDSIFNKYQNVYLIRESGQEEVYYLNPNGIRKHIPSVEIFNSYNDKWEDVQIISQNEMNTYPVSNLIKLNNSPDIYLIEGTKKRRIPSIVVFNKYQYNWGYITTVNQTEFYYYQVGAELG